MAQWLGLCAFTAKGSGSIPGPGTKITQAEWHSQKKKKRPKRQESKKQNKTSSVNYIYHVVHYIPSTYFSYNCKFVPFDCLHFPFPLYLASGNHKSDLFFFEFVCLLVFEV